MLGTKGCASVLVVTDKGIVGHGLHKKLIAALEKADISYFVYDGTVQNPTIDNIEEALHLYKVMQCTAIIAIGGGSCIDCAKGVAARVARPNKTISQLRGLLKVLLPIPTLIAIPTTAGSGSEATVAAVIVDSETREKYGVNDPALIPHYVLFKPELTTGLPPSLTATTGMDALCHAVEAYIGKSNTAETRRDAIRAVKLIFENVYDAYQNGGDLKVRAKMQQAAYCAGVAFTRAYVGNIHALSHAISGKYGTPHGLANAVLMPYVLRSYGKAAHKPLWELACAVGIADGYATKQRGAALFIDAVCELNKKMGIPDKLHSIQVDDIPMLAKRALKEANPIYPVPEIFDEGNMSVLLLNVRSRSEGKV